jgi:osmoprotectant transport system permease protein
VSVASDVATWFGDGSHWRGPFGVPVRAREHLYLAAASLLAALLATFPLAVWLGHRRRGGFLAVNLANIGRAIPTLGILLLAVQWLGLAEWPVIGSVTAWIALTALALAPILTNTYIGLRDVPDAVRESAAAMGMTGWQQAMRVELPLAFPLALAGIRTAAVQVVATATLAAPVGSGGLGRFIVDGLAVRDFSEVVAGALLVAALSLAVDGAFALTGRRVLRYRAAEKPEPREA